MIANVFKKVFGSKNDRELKRMRKAVIKVNELEDSYRELTDEALRAKTAANQRR